MQIHLQISYNIIKSNTVPNGQSKHHSDNIVWYDTTYLRKQCPHCCRSLASWEKNDDLSFRFFQLRELVTGAVPHYLLLPPWGCHFECLPLPPYKPHPCHLSPFQTLHVFHPTYTHQPSSDFHTEKYFSNPKTIQSIH